MSTLFNIFHSIQNSLFPWLEEILDPLTEKEQRFVQVVSLVALKGHMTQYRWHGKGGKRKDRYLSDFSIIKRCRSCSDIKGAAGNA